MKDRDSVMTLDSLPEEQALILKECMERHPAWISRLETDEYYPIAQIPIHKLHGGDIVDVREFRVHIEEANAFMTISVIRCNHGGVHGILGNLPNGQDFIIEREDGLPIRRRKVVRFARRTNI